MEPMSAAGQDRFAVVVGGASVGDWHEAEVRKGKA
jgi:hypothetical protein